LRIEGAAENSRFLWGLACCRKSSLCRDNANSGLNLVLYSVRFRWLRVGISGRTTRKEYSVKWVLLVSFLAIVPPLAAWLRSNPRHRLKFWMVLGFLPFVVDSLHLYMAAYSIEWGGYVKGAEISLLDILALLLYMSLPASRHPLAFRGAMLFYFLAVLLSSMQALAPLQSLFYPWQLARMFLVYAIVAKGCADPQVTRALMRGMAVALIMQVFLVIWQRFGLGLIQTGGSVGHQNLLGIMSHLVILPFFALLLTGARGPLPIAVVLAGAIIDISTASRATVGLAAIGFATIFLLSAIAKWTPRKGRVLLIGVVALALLIPGAVVTFQERFDLVPLGDEESYDERGAYKAAAAMMLTDHPMGIGANHFAVIGNVGQYYEKGKVGAYTSGRAGNVHNIYYLVAAETGYLGLIAFLVLLSAPLIVALRCGLNNLADDKGNLLLGYAVALLAVYFHSWVEWSLATFSAQYLLAIILGMIAANAEQLGYWRSYQTYRRSEKATQPNLRHISRHFTNRVS
jgi:O-antigen ligase